jgi:hypothetical protein
MIESVPWESEEADQESEEAIIEAEESSEDYRRRRKPSRPFQPGRGVQGITLRNQDGRTRTVQFPAKLATVAETNRGMARQELASRALDGRLDQLEMRFRSAQKKDTATTAVVTLAIAGGLSGVGIWQASKQSTSSSGLANWASQDGTKMAAVASLTQLATSGAKLAFNGRYIRSGFGITADVFSVVQLGLFAYGTFQQPTSAQAVADISKMNAANFAGGARIYDLAGNKEYEVLQTNQGNYFIHKGIGAGAVPAATKAA